MIGLSGLITPSLDEMVHVAREMEREGFDDAAADRRGDDQRQAHGGQDRAGYHETGGPRQGRLALRRRRRAADPARDCEPELDRENRALQEQRARGVRASGSERKLVPYAEAVQRRFAIDWDAAARCRSRRSSARSVLRDFPLDEIVPYIDWSPFFMAWELAGKYPQIFNDPHRRRRGAASCSTTPTSCSTSIVKEKLLHGQRASTASSRPTADGDDIVV